MSRVFIIQNSTYWDKESECYRHKFPNIVGQAKFFGEQVEFLLPENFSLTETDKVPSLVDELYEKLADFSPTEDYLIQTGSPATIGLVTSIISDITEGKFRVLIWSNKHKTYKIVAINLTEN